jgi:hypothetical protein
MPATTIRDEDRLARIEERQDALIRGVDMANALSAQATVMARLEARLAALPREIAEALVPGG